MSEELRQQPEDISTPAVLGSAAILLLAIAAAIAAAYGLGSQPRHEPSERPSVPADKNQSVRFSPIEAPPRTVPGLRRAPDRYGWVDRREGVIRIPVDVATDVYLERQARGQP